MVTSSLLASNSPEFESQLWPSVIPGQWCSPLGLSFPSPKQTGYSGRQVSGLLGESLLSWESSLIHGCVWWNPSWAMTRAEASAGGQLTSLLPSGGNAARIQPPLHAVLLLAFKRIWM